MSNNALIFLVYNDRIHGGYMYMFEYFYTIWRLNNDFKLCLVNGSNELKNNLCDVWEDRYNIPDKSYRDNIKLSFKPILQRRSFDKVLVVDSGTTYLMKQYVKSKEYIYISEQPNPEKYLIMRRPQYNATYYGEMPFHHKDHQYTIKIPWDIYKDIGKSNDAVFVSSWAKQRDMEEIATNLYPDKPLIYKNFKHRENFFELFDEMLYIQSGNWFDTMPRLFMECEHYGKTINYHNPKEVKDGGWYRYHDLLENGLNNRHLDENDEIVSQFI